MTDFSTCAPQKLGAESTDAKFSPGSIERSPRGTVCVPMLIEILKTILSALCSVFRSRAVLLAENLVLRQCCAVRCPTHQQKGQDWAKEKGNGGSTAGLRFSMRLTVDEAI
jgi:hypothetical protein